MSFRQLLTARAVTPFLIALVFLILAVGWDGESGAIAASTTGSVEQGGSCPLTGPQEVSAIKAWQKMMPVFRHPRCLNCHGGVPDPLAQVVGTLHMGVVEISSKDDKAICEECHEEGWRLPGHLWTRKDDLEICSDMKMLFTSGDFIDHIVRDGGGVPFIEYAFKGMRGLNEGAGEGAYEDKFGVGTLKADPPPGTHAQLVQQAKDWVKAQGGSFVGDNDCGCMLDKMEVHFRSTLHIANNGPGKETGDITGEGRVVLRLRPDVSEPDWESTTGPNDTHATITWTGVGVTRGNGCLINILASPPTEFSFWLGVSVKPDLRFSLQVVPGLDMHGSFMRCPRPRPLSGWIDGPKDDKTPHIFSAAWASLHGAPDALPMAGLSIPKPGAKPTAPASALDMSKLMSMDPKALEAMAEKMKANQTPAGMADLGKLMNQVLPGADKMAAEASRNFKFAIPATDANGCKLETGTAFLARCEISRTITVPDNKGSTQTITEKTTITIGRPK